MAGRRRDKASAGRALILIMLGIQVMAAALFLFNLLIPILGIPLILDWSVHEAIELVAAISLLAGVVMTVLLLRRVQRRAEHLQRCRVGAVVPSEHRHQRARQHPAVRAVETGERIAHQPAQLPARDGLVCERDGDAAHRVRLLAQPPPGRLGRRAGER